MKNKVTRFLQLMLLALLWAVPTLAHADTAPLDLTATGATLAGYVATAAAVGVGVFAAIYGLRVIIRSFKTVAK